MHGEKKLPTEKGTYLTSLLSAKFTKNAKPITITAEEVFY